MLKEGGCLVKLTRCVVVLGVGMVIMGQRASGSYISKWVNVCKFLCFALFCEQEGTGGGYFFFLNL